MAARALDPVADAAQDGAAQVGGVQAEEDGPDSCMVGHPGRIARCERCGERFERTQPHRRFCSRRCQNNGYFARRLAEDEAFHARAVEYQRLWRVRETARRRVERELAAQQG